MLLFHRSFEWWRKDIYMTQTIKLFKRGFASIVVGFCSLIHTQAQAVMGGGMGIMTPTAEIPQEGTFTGGMVWMEHEMMQTPFNYDTGLYYVSFAPFSWIELTLRETLLKTWNRDHTCQRFYQQDRSLSLRLRLLKESHIRPAWVITAHDPYADRGKNYYASLYSVWSKSLHNEWSGGKWCVSIGYSFPVNHSGFRKGLFGSIGYRPNFPLPCLIAAEYDSQNFNFGAEITLWKHMRLFGCSQAWKHFSGGIAYTYTLTL